MKHIITRLLAILALLVPASLHGQDLDSASEAVETVDAFMAAFNAQDTEAMAQYVLDGTVVAFVQEQDGADRTGFMPMSGLIQSIAGSPADLEEPIWNISARSAGTVAVVFADFEFLVDGNRSHCGTNVFSLMRIDEEWKIATVTYSHITEGCEGPPAE